MRRHVGGKHEVGWQQSTLQQLKMLSLGVVPEPSGSQPLSPAVSALWWHPCGGSLQVSWPAVHCKPPCHRTSRWELDEGLKSVARVKVLLLVQAEQWRPRAA